MLRHCLIAVLVCLLWTPEAFSQAFRQVIPVSDGSQLPIYCFLPRHPVNWRLPAVIVGVGVAGTQIPQYREHCQLLADRNFFVVLMDPSNYPESMAPSPYSWDKGAGYALGSVNQGVVAARLAVSHDWYLRTIKATVDYLCCNPMVDPTRIAFSGHSQPANAALTYASCDPRIKAVVWNYGGWPFTMPYDVLKLPPVLIFHGTSDEVYDVKYAKELIFDLKTNCRPYEACIYPCQKHMFNVYYDMRKENRYMKPALLDAFEKLVCFLNRTLHVPPPVPLASYKKKRGHSARR